MADHEDDAAIVRKVENFVRDVVIPYETDDRRDDHGPLDALVQEMRAKAREAGVLTPHIRADGTHISHRATARVLRASGLSPLGPLACNTNAPDEGNMFLLGKVATAEQKRRYLDPMVAGNGRSCFLMTEPAAEGGTGSDPSMMQTVARLEGGEWVINGRKAFATGFAGASFAILMAKTERDDGAAAATMFLVPLPHPALVQERLIGTIDSSMPGGHAVVKVGDLRLPPDAVLGAPHEGFAYAQVRLAPARLTHCMRWLGAATRANEIATDYAVKRQAFGKPLIDHEGVGFMLADNLIDLKQCELMIDWCADVLDSGEKAITESSMAKVAVSETLFRVADRCVQVMGGTGVSHDTIVEQVFREIRAFRIYDGPTEVHKWSLAKKIKREALAKS
ncbi:acyl-CoA dehydrogenase [Sphingomonadales bacterium 56]|uniref:acyl-CoA dehydrogenase family protein n=1 Tax=unclassified Sphingobium TaxID=2611147 RepID=UPI0019181428|nr:MULTISPECIES: acyl-CoA dehydrogenase [unclassified Sphingobium]MBY2930194.1 acyl-CoA dehydrogenase [Sphingomonadales bacterium 56]MBY2959921.1 acyl-CoA dehydrogenase [Sphingomonadales bacterium 58]CAD7339950.1 Caffeyl-CoA reductase-Etf complex subunit CarC [Sphingobium sp. S8]CAD7340905.1 Caffeyl-CoA reductase-Etf complex subunit CarC [Sphingobium sp. S6]